MSLDKAETSIIQKNLVEQIKNGECILFFGAGVHAPPLKAKKSNEADAHHGFPRLMQGTANDLHFAQKLARE